ncbi:MAG TPA: tRNA (guanosine(37)-N1)-methyltransferase TrmD, partial [Rhodospirillales bacterium]
MFPGPLAHSLAGQGLAAGAWALEALDIRDFAEGRHRSVDDAPFGGGPGMVMRPDVVARAIESARHAEPALKLIYLTPRGRPFDQALALELAAGAGVTLLCGRYEGLE